jgi:hypothetical protein
MRGSEARGSVQRRDPRARLPAHTGISDGNKGRERFMDALKREGRLRRRKRGIFAWIFKRPRFSHSKAFWTQREDCGVINE